MKFSILALGAAVAGISSQCVAQLHIESSFPTRAPEARLVSQQDPVGSSFFDDQSNKEQSNQDASAYFAPTPQAEIEGDEARDPQSILNDSESLAPTAQAQNAQGPAGKVVNKQVAPLDVLAMTPEVGMVPVCWQNAGGCPTPNPIATYMMQSWCTNGLWDSYACQRARQCAHIQQQMCGHNRYTCKGCAACGTGHHHVQAVGCASCAPAASQCAQNNAVPASTKEIVLPAQTLMTSAPAVQSPYLGEMQVGLPALDVSQLPSSTMPAAQLTTTPANRLPNGQPLLQLPSDVPSVPQDIVVPSIPMPSVLPALPVPSAEPVVARRPSASLR